MKTRLTRDGAKLVHPDKAFILRHIPLAQRHYRELEGNCFLYLPGPGLEDQDPELVDYIIRLHQSVETLYGSVDFDLHTVRAYTEAGLEFHRDFDTLYDDDEDFEDEDEGTIVRMVSCIHNATELHRPLTFRRKLDTGHLEQFDITIPAGTILTFSDGLMFDYQHGIEPSEEAEQYKSVLTRFKKVVYDE